MRKFCRLLRWCILFIAIISLTINVYGQSYTLAEVLCVPYAANLVCAQDADRIAWILNEEGVRNIWTAAAPDFEPVQLTDYSTDDGIGLSQLVFTPDGTTLVFVRGGAANKVGEYPNPTSNPKGAEQIIWAIASKGGSTRKLANGSNPVISPNGDLMLFTKNGQIYEVALSQSLTDSICEVKQTFIARGSNRNPRWAPDGQSILFVSDRGDHSFIGIFLQKTQKIRWIAPSVDRDMSPVWSPDGQKIAFIRIPGALKDEHFNLTGGWSFAIWVVDLNTDEEIEVWHSPADDGLFAQWYPDHTLRWAKNNRLLFYSEHEGWLHIYSMTPSGEDLVDLTSGSFEVEHSALSPNGKILYYSSNQGDIDRRHIWQVSTLGGTPVQLTKGSTIETNPVTLSSETGIAYRHATAQRPQTITLMMANKDQPEMLSPLQLPEHFPVDELVVPQQVIYTASDGYRIHAQLFMPRDAKVGEKRPAVIFMHGGPIRQMLLGWHYMGYYSKTYAMNQYLANKGYIVLSINFRSGIGYGRDFRRAEMQGPRGASEYQDVIAAAQYLRKRSEVDPEKIGLWGGSYGGYLTALGLARNSDLFAAGVDLHGVHDWKFRATDFSPGGFWGLQGEELLALAYQSSPVADLSNWSSPILLVHGDDDRNVMFAQTTDLVQRLRKHDVHVEILVFPDEVHGFLRHENWLRTFLAAADFFDRFL